jgi:hypothetical protein
LQVYQFVHLWMCEDVMAAAPACEAKPKGKRQGDKLGESNVPRGLPALA